MLIHITQRVGSHGFDVTKDGKAFVPHLYVHAGFSASLEAETARSGRNSIYMYEVDTLGVNGELHFLDEVVSPRSEDGPRHVWPHPNGKLLYTVSLFRLRQSTQLTETPTDYGAL